MLLDTFENYLVSVIIGIVIGLLIGKYYYEKTRNYSVGKAIESAMISGNIEILINYCKDLQLLLSEMDNESDNLLDQIIRSGDIESLESIPIVKKMGIEDGYTVQSDEDIEE